MLYFQPCKTNGKTCFQLENVSGVFYDCAKMIMVLFKQVLTYVQGSSVLFCFFT